MIEWYGTGGHTADCGDLTLEAFGSGFTFRAVVSVNGEPLLHGFDYPTLDAAKLAAETFAREWVAKQAAALGDGWISTEERLPENDGWYHVAVHDYKGRYPRHAVAEFTRDRFWIADDDGEGDSVFAWRGSALPPCPSLR